MSRESVEIVWRAIAAATAKPPDFEVVDELYHHEHVLTTDWGVEAKTYRGLQGFAEAMADTDAAWQEWHQEVEQVLDAGDRGVVALVRLKARGRESGAPVDQAWAMVMTVRDGKLTSSRTFLNRDQALRFAGLAA
jgi:ketosteroid isomerase-like protein